MGKNTIDGDGIIQVEWVESKSFLELTNIELKERDDRIEWAEIGSFSLVKER